MDLGKNIKQLRKQCGLSQEELANAIGVSRAAVTQWETGWSQPRMGMIEKLSKYFNVSKTAIIDGPSAAQTPTIPSNAIHVRGSSAMVPVRVLGSTHAGERMDEIESDYEAEFPEGVVSRHPGCFALKVEGDCMNRRFPEGCMVLVDPRAEPRNGSAVVAEFDDGRSLLRVYMRGSSTLMLTADSFSDYDDLIITPDDPPVNTVGVVVWYQAEKDIK